MFASTLSTTCLTHIATQLTAALRTGAIVGLKQVYTILRHWHRLRFDNEIATTDLERQALSVFISISSSKQFNVATGVKTCQRLASRNLDRLSNSCGFWLA